MDIMGSILVFCVLRMVVKMRVNVSGKAEDAKDLTDLQHFHLFLHPLHLLHGLNVKHIPKEKNI